MGRYYTTYDNLRSTAEPIRRKGDHGALMRLGGTADVLNMTIPRELLLGVGNALAVSDCLPA